jgi:hypothetical protein
MNTLENPNSFKKSGKSFSRQKELVTDRVAA